MAALPVSVVGTPVRPLEGRDLCALCECLVCGCMFWRENRDSSRVDTVDVFTCSGCTASGRVDVLQEKIDRLSEEVLTLNEVNSDLTKKLDSVLVGQMVESVRYTKAGRNSEEQGEVKGDGIEGDWRTARGSEGDWRTVRGGGKGQSGTDTVGNSNIKTRNGFALLEESEGDDENAGYTVVGDSIVKYFKDSCTRGKKRVRRMVRSSPGAGVERILEHLDSEEVEGDTVVIHAGTNDVIKVGSEKLFDLFKAAINKVRSKGKKCIISSIIPRKYESRYWFSRALGQNNRIKELCKEMDDCFFVDTWFDFWNKDEFYSRDGIHLSNRGERFLSNRLDEAVAHLSNFEQRLSIRNKR